MRMMSRCFTWFPILVGLGEPKIYHDLGFYKNVVRLNGMHILFLIRHPLATNSFRCSFFSLRFLPSSRNILVISLNLLLECFFIREK